MAKQIGEVKRKKSSHAGAFFLGWFFGFILTIGLLVGGGAFLYFKVSPAWLNRTFKVGIDLGSNELNELTLNKAVSYAINLGKNYNTYTLNDLKKDFGIDVGSSVYGIDITDLKAVPLGEISGALQTKLNNISAYELKDLVDLSSLDSVLNKSKTYYYKEGDNAHLYKDKECTEVAFDCTITGTNVKIKNFDINPVINTTTNETTVQLKYVPLNLALDSASDLAGDVKLSELGDNLPNWAKKLDPDTKISELETAMKTLKVADLLDFTISGETVADKDGQPVTGIMAVVAKKSISELNSSNVFDDIMLQDVFTTTELGTGVLSLLPADTTLKGISTAFEEVFDREDLTMSDLFKAGMLTDLQGKTIITNKEGTNKVLVDTLKYKEFVSIVTEILTASTEA